MGQVRLSVRWLQGILNEKEGGLPPSFLLPSDKRLTTHPWHGPISDLNNPSFSQIWP